MAEPGGEDLLPLLGLGINQVIEHDELSENSSTDTDVDEDDIEVEMAEEVVLHDEGEGPAYEDEAEIRPQRVRTNVREKKMKKRRSSSDNVSNPRQQLIVNFDQSLPGTHSYLGNDLEDIRGRTILEENCITTLPLLVLPNVVLVPGQVLPLQLFSQRQVAMLRRVAGDDKTFGVINISVQGDGQSVSPIGCTAEIFSMKDELHELSGLSMIRVKARGRQRFKIIDAKSEITGELMAKVKILPEVSLTHVLNGACLPSNRRFLVKPSDDSEMLKTAVDRQGQVITSVDCRRRATFNRFHSSKFTWWPSWVYRMYDIEWLSEQTRAELDGWSSSPLPSDPTELSFWVAHNLLVDDQIRLELLTFDSVVQRLRYGLSIIRKSGFLLKCNDCEETIANQKEVFSMSREGPIGTFVNPGGHVHEMFTVVASKGLRNIGRSSTEHSWFPGYAWTIVQCKNCGNHTGWMFTATKKELSPKKFWGLCRSSVTTSFTTVHKMDGDNKEEAMIVV